jgi:hypothetical protein
MLVAATSSDAASPTVGGGAMTSIMVVSSTRISPAPSTAAEPEVVPVDTSEWTGSSVQSSPSTTPNCEDLRSSPARLKSLPVSSLRTLLLHERSGVEVLASPDATAGGRLRK